MQWTKFLRTSGMAALAAALVIPAVSAQAQDGQWRNRGERAAEHQRAQQGTARADRRIEPRADRSARAAAPRQSERQGVIRADRQNERTARQAERRGDQRPAQVAQGRDWQDRNRNPNPNLNPRNPNWNSRDWNQRNNPNWRDNNRDLRDNNRNWRNNDRDWRDNNNRYRNSQPDRRDFRQDQRRWDRLWRNDNRYNWQNYRQSNRGLYSMGRYYAPYRDYSYRRLSIGLRLNSLFYASRYWINDPWQYRLPAAYGSYRWIRYYDDVLLVDTYSGEVVDVIHNFFW